jgi:thioredoxin 1
MAGKALELTDQTFAETIASGVTLVDFWAPWCGPCQMQGPIVESVVEKVDGKAKVAKLNVDQGQQAAAQYGVRSIPTLIVFKDGEQTQQFVGVQSEPQLVAAIERALGG